MKERKPIEQTARTFYSLTDGEAVDLIPHLTVCVRGRDDVRIYVGTDSQNKEACTVFGTVVVVHCAMVMTLLDDRATCVFRSGILKQAKDEACLSTLVEEATTDFMVTHDLDLVRLRGESTTTWDPLRSMSGTVFLFGKTFRNTPDLELVTEQITPIVLPLLDSTAIARNTFFSMLADVYDEQNIRPSLRFIYEYIYRLLSEQDLERCNGILLDERIKQQQPKILLAILGATNTFKHKLPNRLALFSHTEEVLKGLYGIEETKHILGDLA